MSLIFTTVIMFVLHLQVGEILRATDNGPVAFTNEYSLNVAQYEFVWSIFYFFFISFSKQKSPFGILVHLIILYFLLRVFHGNQLTVWSVTAVRCMRVSFPRSGCTVKFRLRSVIKRFMSKCLLLFLTPESKMEKMEFIADYGMSVTTRSWIFTVFLIFRFTIGVSQIFGNIGALFWEFWLCKDGFRHLAGPARGGGEEEMAKKLGCMRHLHVRLHGRDHHGPHRSPVAPVYCFFYHFFLRVGRVFRRGPLPFSTEPGPRYSQVHARQRPHGNDARFVSWKIEFSWSSNCFSLPWISPFSVPFNVCTFPIN